MEGKAQDPRIHRAAMKMARRFVNIIAGILMDNEKPEALRQAYFVAKDGIEEFKAGKDGG